MQSHHSLRLGTVAFKRQRKAGPRASAEHGLDIGEYVVHILIVWPPQFDSPLR